MFPVLVFLIITSQELYFAILFCISVVTDALDGLIARLFHMQTDVGARLDSIADNGLFISAFLGLLKFKSTEMQAHWVGFSLFFGLFAVCILLSLVRFRRMPSLHLYSWKIGGYIQGIFMFTTFAFGFKAWLFYAMLAWSIPAFVEHIIIQLTIKQMQTNAKGLYWVLRNKKGAINAPIE
jgi:CDP-diacylglycerol--glycerol-3-phosphate 3-phosphatidyltransferase